MPVPEIGDAPPRGFIQLCDSILLERGVRKKPRPPVARGGTRADDCLNPEMFVIRDTEEHATGFERRTNVGFAEHLGGQMFWKETAAF